VRPMVGPDGLPIVGNENVRGLGSLQRHNFHTTAADSKAKARNIEIHTMSLSVLEDGCNANSRNVVTPGKEALASIQFCCDRGPRVVV
jgi:hypothetical protein